MKVTISRREMASAVDGLKRLDGYMRRDGVPYTERMPYLRAKSRMDYLLKQEIRRSEKSRKRKEVTDG